MCRSTRVYNHSFTHDLRPAEVPEDDLRCRWALAAEIAIRASSAADSSPPFAHHTCSKLRVVGVRRRAPARKLMPCSCLVCFVVFKLQGPQRVDDVREGVIVTCISIYGSHRPGTNTKFVHHARFQRSDVAPRQPLSWILLAKGEMVTGKIHV